MASAVLLLILGAVGLLAAARWAVQTDRGRAEVVRLLNDYRVGPFGVLRIEGLQGDPLTAFTLRRLQVVDARGVWLDAQDLSMKWRWRELLTRRFHADFIRAGSVTVFRRPVAVSRSPKPLQPLPVSVEIDDLRLRLETLPAFSVRRGLYRVDGSAEVARNYAAHGRVDALSLMHAGDGLRAAFQYGLNRPIVVRADAVEAAGGALAGALGLPADQRLTARARGDGTAAAGALSLDTLSGNLHPLTARASWGKAGGRLDAQVVLAASRLLAPYADRLGPTLTVSLTGARRSGEVYDTNAILSASYAQLRATGPVEVKARRTAGLKLTGSVADLSRWLHQPAIGPVRTSGVLTGGLDAFTYKGAATAERVAAGAYTFRTVSGPVTIARSGAPDKPEWRVQAELAAAGGAGQKLTQALLGSSPRASVDASWLSDKRFLFRTLKVAGPGLKVDASGGQGLFGGLSFKGSAQLSNLAVAHAGAHGLLNATWSAGQAKGAKAWDFTLDARATALATGFPQADKLLGPAPHLAGRGAYGPAGLEVARADLTGLSAAVSVHGALSPRQVMALDGDWSLKGPFVAGPLEIAGGVKGTGRITGTFKAPRADLKADLASLDFEKLVVTPAHLDLTLQLEGGVVEGVGALAGLSNYGPASARTAFRLAGGGVDLTGMSADAGGVKLAGSLALRNGAPSTADLTFAAGPGAFLTHGRATGSVKLADQPGGLQAAIALDGQDLSAPQVNGSLHLVHLHAVGPLSHLPFQLSAETVNPLPATFAGSGVFARNGQVDEVSLQGGGRVRSVNYRTLEPVQVRLAPANRSVRLRAEVAGGRLALDGRQSGGGAAGGLTAHATLAGVGLGALQQDMVGRIAADLTLQGQGTRLTGALDATLDGARSRDAPANLALASRLKATLDGQRLHVDASATNTQGLTSHADLDLPAEASASPFRIAIDRTKPIRGDFAAEGELRPLWDLAAGGDRTLSGRVSTRGTVGGTLNKLQASGQASLAKGRFQDSASGLNLQDLTVSADFDRSVLTVRKFSGDDGRGGLLGGTGRVALEAGGESTFALTLKRFQLLDSQLGRATASGAVTVSRDAKGLARLTGALTINRADLVPPDKTPPGVVTMDVVEIHVPEGMRRDRPAAKTGVVTLDVALTAPRGVFVRGKGLDAELSLDAHVGGTTAKQQLSGMARVIRGSYDAGGKRFDFDDRGTVTLASSPDNIRLNLTATRSDPALTAVIKITGTAARPEIALSSTPVLPQDEVLAQVLFGRSASQLSAGEAAQLASTLASLSGGGGFDLIGNLRQFARLDRLALGGDQTTGTTISGGKYLTNNIYVELTGGGRYGTAASVELRLRRNLAIVSSYAAQSETRLGQPDTRVSVRFRKDFK